MCSVDGCEREMSVKGYCKKHYSRQYRHGDPLKTKINRKSVTKINYEDFNKQIDGIPYKKCTVCAEWKLADENHFYKNKKNRFDGLHIECKKCAVQRVYKWRTENREAYEEQYKRNNILPKAKVRRREDTKKRRENGKYYEWLKANPENIARYKLNRMHKKHEISAEEWAACKEYFNECCAYCGITLSEHTEKFNESFHKEHVNHEGSNKLDNCVPACKSCNCSKWAHPFESWYLDGNPAFSKARLNKIKRWLEKDHKKYIAD